MNFLKSVLSSFIGFIIAGAILIIVSISMLTAVISMSEEPNVVESNSILLLRLDGQIIDRDVENPFGDIPSPFGQQIAVTGLNEIIGSINRAKNDDNIVGIYLNNGVVNVGYASLMEIREALIDFKESGKFIYSYSDISTTKAYYLSSVADSIVFNPYGMLEFQGLASERMFLKGALDKLGIDYQIIRGTNNKFKSYIEQYTRTDMSSESREQTQQYLNSIWGTIVSEISESRGVSVDRLNELADSVLTLSDIEDSRDAGLVDNLKYKDEAIEDIVSLTNVESEDDLRLVSVDDYFYSLSGKEIKGYISDKVAVIYAEGAIDGASGEGIDSKKLSRVVRDVRNDDAVKAVVIRINSPGGSAFGSEVVWREVMLTQKEKPVVVSMGDVAASGGYYISAGAGTIVAEPTTITGSIGIFMAIPNAKGLISDKLGVTFDGVGTNKNSADLTITRPFSDFERAALQKSVDRGYLNFLSRVAMGRDRSIEEIDTVAQGRVWSGAKALELGLVDELGGLDRAIEIAKEKSNLIDKECALKILPEVKDPITEMLEDLTGQSTTFFGESKFGLFYNHFKELEEISSLEGMQARVPYNLNIN